MFFNFEVKLIIELFCSMIIIEIIKIEKEITYHPEFFFIFNPGNNITLFRVP